MLKKCQPNRKDVYKRQHSGLRKKYDATVLAIRRGKEFIISPKADQIIENGDVLILLGNHDKLKQFETEI